MGPSDDSAASVAKALSRFPRTIAQLERFTARAVAILDEELALYRVKAAASMRYRDIIEEWQRIAEDFCYNIAILHYLFLTTADVDLLQSARLASEFLREKIYEVSRDEEIIGLLLAYGERTVGHPADEQLAPGQLYVLTELLKRIVEGASAEGATHRRSVHLLQALSDHTTLPYTFRRGDAPCKALPPDRRFTILSWNMCCFDDVIPLCFGGVVPWQDRSQRMAQLIGSADADVICLMEVFSSRAADHFYTLLKGQYCHFYINIGPRPCHYYVKDMDIPSGLFVASKYPLANAHFTPFGQGQTSAERGYGFFRADIQDGDRVMACLIGTHLHPGYQPQDSDYRYAQLQAIIQSCDRHRHIPTFICGDLNIERDSAEYERSIKPFFDNCYRGHDWTCCELRDYWWKTAQDRDAFLALPPTLEWIDYFLAIGRCRYDSVAALHTEVLRVCDLLSPHNALSDHQILYTTVTMRPY